jgi:hypothetical protein
MTMRTTAPACNREHRAEQPTLVFKAKAGPANGLVSSNEGCQSVSVLAVSHRSTHLSLMMVIAAAIASARSPPGVPSMGF